MNQYQIILNGTKGPVEDALPDRWSEIGRVSEQRGWTATLRRRLVTDEAIVPMLGGELPDGWMDLRGIVVSPWSIIAELKPRPGVLVIGCGKETA